MISEVECKILSYEKELSAMKMHIICIGAGLGD